MCLGARVLSIPQRLPQIRSTRVGSPYFEKYAREWNKGSQIALPVLRESIEGIKSIPICIHVEALFPRWSGLRDGLLFLHSQHFQHLAWLNFSSPRRL